MDERSTPHRSKNTEVVKVRDLLNSGNYHGFIRYYIENCEKLNAKRGQYFTNFMNTCKTSLMTNDHYKHYNRTSKECITIRRGPTLTYIKLLKHIIHNARRYERSDAEKIYQLLWFFEQEGITHNIIIPKDDIAITLFEANGSPPSFSGKDGTADYCSLDGKTVKHDGMEISNTRVNALLHNIHHLGDDDHDDDDDDDHDHGDDDVGPGLGLGGKRRTKTNKRKYRYSRHASRRRPSTTRRRLSTTRRRHR